MTIPSMTGRCGSGWRESIFRFCATSARMKKVHSLTMILAAMCLLGTTSVTQETNPTKPKPSPQQIYHDMRIAMLQGSRAKLGLPPGVSSTDPWGVLMDQGLERGTFTTIAICDGSASLYFSNGGGYIGGKGQEPIRKAAEDAVRTARDFQTRMMLTNEYPIAEKDQIIFYLMTDSGVFTAKASVSDLKTGAAQFSPLWHAMQNVVTEYRLWDQAGRKGGGGTLVPPK
jgi:hypothetical protein